MVQDLIEALSRPVAKSYPETPSLPAGDPIFSNELLILSPVKRTPPAPPDKSKVEVDQEPPSRP